MAGDSPRLSLIHDPETRDRGIRLGLAHGSSEAARRLGVPVQTVSDWLRRYRADEYRARAALGEQDPQNAPNEVGPPVKWPQRMQAEADEAGRDAQLVRDLAVQAMVNGEARLVGAGARLYDVLITKAQLLSGGATGREDMSATERKQRLLTIMTDLQNERRRRDTA
jgi:hypothetical protein